MNDKAKKGGKVKQFLRQLGPGLITGVSDDDPSGIATFAQAGAKFGFHLLWTLIFLYPIIVAIQRISAQIGATTGRGVAGNVRRYYSKWLLYPVVLLLFVANTINIGADLVAMGEAMRLMAGGPVALYAVLFAVVSIVAEIFISYGKYSNLLKWLSISLLSYIITLFFIHIPVKDVLSAVVFPRISFDKEYLQLLVAVFGTTISPYLLFWQSSLEAEEEEDDPHRKPLKQAPRAADRQIRRIRTDTMTGLAVANGVAFFIMLTTAATLHKGGVTEIQTAAQAAKALAPFAGQYGEILFSLGIIGNGLLAVPVLAGSAAYALGEAIRLPRGLGRKPREAKGFYAILGGATLLGLVMVLLHVDPIKALIWSAIINGAVAAPLMIPTMLLAENPKTMDSIRISKPLRILGWLATVIMILTFLGMVVTLF